MKVCLCYAGYSDLTNRFTIVCNTAVDWVVYGVEPYTTEHAQFLLDDEVTLPSNITLDMDASRVRVDVAFLRYLIGFFHRALQPVLRKVSVWFFALC